MVIEINTSWEFFDLNIPPKSLDYPAITSNIETKVSKI